MSPNWRTKINFFSSENVSVHFVEMGFYRRHGKVVAAGVSLLFYCMVLGSN